MLNQNFDILAAILALIGSLNYVWATYKGKARPNLVSWGLWTIVPFITFAAEIAQHVSVRITLLTLSESIGPLLVVIAALAIKQAHWQISTLDIWCGVIAVLSVLLWLITGKGNIAIFFSLFASLFSAIPTFIKAYKFPTSESPGDYVASTIAGIITLLTIQHWTLGNYGFPIYITLECGIITFLVLTPGRIRTSELMGAGGLAPETTGTTPVPVIPVVPAASIAPISSVLPGQPTKVVGASPTRLPVLSWQPVPNATQYNIYRENALVGTTKTSTFTDDTANNNSYHYHVTAVSGDRESVQSDQIEILVDQTPPSLSYELSSVPNSAGWHNSPVTITFAGSDEVAGIASCSPAVTLDKDGQHQPVTGSAMNFAGDSSSISLVVNIDQTPPVLGLPIWTNNPVTEGDKTTLTVPVVDHLSGVAGGEYIGLTDPGVGLGGPMKLKQGQLSVIFDTNLNPGKYELRIRARDLAGNWSDLVSTTLEILPAPIMPTV